MDLFGIVATAQEMDLIPYPGIENDGLRQQIPPYLLRIRQGILGFLERLGLLCPFSVSLNRNLLLDFC